MPCDASGGWVVNVEVTGDSSKGVATADYWWTGGGEHSTPLFLGSGSILVLEAEHLTPDTGEHRSAERPGIGGLDRYECPITDYGSAVSYLVRAEISYVLPPVEPTAAQQRTWCEGQWWWESYPSWCPSSATK